MTNGSSLILLNPTIKRSLTQKGGHTRPKNINAGESLPLPRHASSDSAGACGQFYKLTAEYEYLMSPIYTKWPILSVDSLFPPPIGDLITQKAEAADQLARPKKRPPRTTMVGARVNQEVLFDIATRGETLTNKGRIGRGIKLRSNN